MRDDDHEPTAAQREWGALASLIRRKLTEAAQLIPAMKPEEMMEFMTAVQRAHRLDVDAETFDRQVEIELTKTAFQE